MKDEKLPATTTPIGVAPLATLTLLESAREGNADIETIKIMADLYREERADQRRMEYSIAMTKAQTEMRPVATDSSNKQTHSKYASYAALDKAVRPIYTKYGFGLSFDTDVSPVDGCVRVLCDVSHSGGHSTTHKIDMPADGKGAKGGDVMTKTHATGAATSYGMRYLLKMIFNLSVGEDDTDGNTPVETINAAQVKVLAGLCKKLDNLAPLLDWAGVKWLEEFPANLFDEALKGQNKRLAKIEQEENVDADGNPILFGE